MNKLYEIYYENMPVAFVKERMDGVKKCQRHTFPAEMPEASFSVPTPIFNKYKEQIRIDNNSKTIKALIKKLAKDISAIKQENFDEKAIKNVLKTYIDVSNDSKQIFRVKKIEEDN